MAQNAATPLQTAPVATPGGQQRHIAFRKATLERDELLASEIGLVMTGATQRIERTVEGGGFLYGIVLDVRAVTAANAVGAVAFAEDGPWSALDTVVLRDVNAELVNVPGFDLFIANLMGVQYATTFISATGAAALSTLFTATTGGGATAGSFTFLLRVPVGINRRALTGIMGNQDRAQKYQLRTDIAGSGAVYSTAPTNLPGGGGGTYQIDKVYENYALPFSKGPRGEDQDVLPGDFGSFHFTTSFSADAAPVASSPVNHFLRRLGNSVRSIALVFRAGAGATQRATADATPPTAIRFKVGDDTVYNETYRYRRFLMFERFGFDFPLGVLVYDAMHDFARGAGDEAGDDYWHTQGLNNMQFQVSYSSAFVASSSLKIITDDMVLAGSAAA